MRYSIKPVRLLYFHSDLLFSMETSAVLKSLETVVPEWHRLGLALGLPEATLSTIEHDHHRSVDTCMRKMVQKWLHSPRLNPSWCSLVRALQAIPLGAAAAKISKEHCKSGTIPRTLSLGFMISLCRLKPSSET